MNASLTVSRTAAETDGGDWAATCKPWARPSRAVAWAGSGAARRISLSDRWRM